MKINENYYISITVEEYKRMRKNEIRLQELEGAGVDNWAGYDQRWKWLLHEYPDFEDVDEILEYIINKEIQKKWSEINE